VTDQSKSLAKENKNNLGKYLSSEALILAVVPVIAYLAIYSYHSGYFNVFSIPTQIIEFSPIEVFRVSGILLAIAFTIFIWGDIVISSVEIFPPIVAVRLRRGIIISIIYLVLIPFVLDPKVRDSWCWIAIGGPLVFFSVELLLPLLTQRKEQGYQAKLRVAEESKYKSESDNDWQTSLEKLLAFLGPWIAGVLFLLIIVYGLGRYKALTRDKFYVLSEKPSIAILWLGSNRAVMSEYDPNTNQISPTLSIFNLDKEEINIRLQDIGPLIPHRDGLIIFKDRPTVTPTITPNPTIRATEDIEPKATKTRGPR